jgi:hypothetical protein
MQKGYARWAMKYLLNGKQWLPIERPMLLTIANEAAFETSVRRVIDWKFDRIIVAHGPGTGSRQGFVL